MSSVWNTEYFSLLTPNHTGAGAHLHEEHLIQYKSYTKNNGLVGLSTEKAMAPHSSTLAWKIPWTEEPGGLQPMGSEESDTTEQLHFHFSLSCIGEGNGNPLQCSCLENPRDGGAWWATVYGVAPSQTGLKWLSSSSSRIIKYFSLKVDLWRKENFRRIWTSLHFLQNKWNSVFFVFFKSQLLFIL